MFRSIKRVPLRIRAFGALAGVVLVGVAAFGVGAKEPVESQSDQTPTEQSALPAPNVVAGQTPSSDTSRDQRAREQIGAEVITITRFGFETREITRPTGRFFLIFENRSNVRGLTLRLISEAGGRIVDVRQPPDELDWAEEINPPPGRYTLTVAERPELACRLTITER